MPGMLMLRCDELVCRGTGVVEDHIWSVFETMSGYSCGGLV